VESEPLDIGDLLESSEPAQHTRHIDHSEKVTTEQIEGALAKFNLDLNVVPDKGRQEERANKRADLKAAFNVRKT
jgi:hypothetical protein